jgi:D-glycero-D-manno-heptose 1,7-bisphosphate phosphatase
VNGRAAVFLDRDGVLNELVPDRASGAYESPLRVEEVRLIQGAAAALTRLVRAGLLLACVSNQPAAAKGTVRVGQLLAVHSRVIELLARDGVRLDASRLCLHHPDGVMDGLAGRCSCRKPAPGMLLDVGAVLAVDMSASWMVGDTDSDVGAGRAAGCRTVLVEYPGSAHKRCGEARPELRAPSLAAAVVEILRCPLVGDSDGDRVAGRSGKSAGNRS